MPFSHAEGCSAYLEYEADSDGADFCPGAIDANSDAVDAEQNNAVEAFCSGNGHCYMSQFNELRLVVGEYTRSILLRLPVASYSYSFLLLLLPVSPARG